MKAIGKIFLRFAWLFVFLFDTHCNDNACYYVLCGAFVEVHFNFAGTGSGTTVSFTLPFTSYNMAGGISDQFPIEITKDNGSGVIVPADGKAQVLANSTTCNLFKTAGAIAWIPLLTRQSAGSFRYLKAS